jgi:hypothetical protein
MGLCNGFDGMRGRLRFAAWKFPNYRIDNFRFRVQSKIGAADDAKAEYHLDW